MIWLLIFLLTMLAGIFSIIYLISRVRKFKFIEKISNKSKKKSIIISSILLFLVIILLYLIFGNINTIIIIIHLFIISFLVELISGILRKYAFNTNNKKDKLNIDNELNTKENVYTLKKIEILIKTLNEKMYIAGIVTILITSIYLAKGWYNDRHVVITEYTVASDKVEHPLKIVQFTDSHLGTTFDGEGFKKHIETINSLNPDVIVFTGDYVDGSSTDSDIITATNALSALKSKYGVYFCFGNHDKNVYGEESKRSIKSADLVKKLEDNKVNVLQDDVCKITDGYTIIGRRDKVESDRLAIQDLMDKADNNDFVIDMNHQPNDYVAEEAAGVDLVLSGHTHGGQFFPINDAGVWMGENDKTYGYEKRGNTNFIVSSGISDWAIDFKTGCISEIVVINVKPISN